MMALIFKSSEIKYTCACCGFKSLPTNSIGEICPICFWEENYGDINDSFDVSSANKITLYQAQENYKSFGSYKLKFSSRCRKPHRTEIKDINWLSVQEKIKMKYDEVSSYNQLLKLCETLKRTEADIEFKNFKRLRDIDIIRNHTDMTLDYLESEEKITALSNQLFFKSLLINTIKSNADLLEKILSKYYNEGVCYYITWSIIIFVLIEYSQSKLGEEAINIFLDIENNNYFGLDSLEIALTNYWHIP